MADRNKFAKKELSDDGTAVTFKFNDGIDVYVHVKDFPADIVAHFTQHGIGQKLGDSYAKSGVDTPEAARDEVEALIAQLMEGNWRAATEGGGPKAGKLVRALFRMIERGIESTKDSNAAKLAVRICSILGIVLKDATIQIVREAVAKLTDEMKKTVGASGEVKSEFVLMAEEEAEKAPSLMA